MNTILDFIAPPPGFEPHLRFCLSDVHGAVGLYTLASEEDEERRVFLLDAAVYLPDYSPTLSLEQSTSLGLESAADARLYVVANPAYDDTTVNLLAPVVVNALTGASAQIILDGDWPLQAPLGD